MRVVMSGAASAAKPVREELEAAGHEVLAPAETVPGRNVQAYVQLPQLLPVVQDGSEKSLTARMGEFLAHGLLARFSEAAALLPHLADEATIVLVGGNTPVPGTAVDDQQARLALLRVLAHALRAEEAPRRLRVRVLPHATSPEQVVRTALGEAVDRQPASEPSAGEDAELSYEDWRTQVLGLATVEF